uniref:cAMP-dependent protein kinase inhibitor alpha-like isoform X2 n=1 Tax=Myxine glutinosa TaxID=7769 RepID=UPI00358F5944
MMKNSAGSAFESPSNFYWTACLRYEEFLADMTDVGSAYAEFVATGRSGRRNAVPDIRDSPAGTDSPELHQKLSDLSLTPEGENEAQIASNSEATKQEESGPT